MLTRFSDGIFNLIHNTGIMIQRWHASSSLLKLFRNFLPESHFSGALSRVNNNIVPSLVGSFVRTPWLVGSFVQTPWLVLTFLQMPWLVALVNIKRGSFVRKLWHVALVNDNAMHQPMRSQHRGRGSLWLANSGDIAAGASSTGKQNL